MFGTKSATSKGLTAKRLMTAVAVVSFAAIAIPAGAGAQSNGRGGIEVDPLPKQEDLPVRSCDAGTLDDVTAQPGLMDTVMLSDKEVNFTKGTGLQVLEPGTIDYYYRGTCQIPYLLGGLTVSDIGPTCARIKFESLANDVTVGSRYSEEICQDLDYGNDYIDIELVGVGHPGLSSVKVHTQIQDNTGTWVNVDSVGRIRGEPVN